MKRIVSAIIVCALLMTCVFALASCSKTLSGTYQGTGVLKGTYYAFDGNNVTITVEVPDIPFVETEDIEITGTYKITTNDKGEDVIVFTFGDDEDAKAYSGEFTFAEGTEGDTKYIKIAGLQYNKTDK